jgi:deferrochelatase/peroxidase EfeB
MSTFAAEMQGLQASQQTFRTDTDPQVAFHAVRQLARLGYGQARLRWTQVGFNAGFAPTDTPRNLMGFRDGTQNPSGGVDLTRFVWAAEEAPLWMRGGSIQVVRRIRIALDHWDNTPTDFQEETIGRQKLSGAPLGSAREFDAPNLHAADADGNPVIPDNAHIRLASAESNGGARILRRGFSYNDGTSVTAERWPPWRQGLEYDAGLFFIAYQRDPRTGFIRLFQRMAAFDALNQFTTHVGSGLFACPGGATEGTFLGQALFES